jgi:hypothetical protein
MSAANRGAVRNERDFYETPQWAVGVVLDRVPLPLNVIDAGCGSWAIGRELVARGHSVVGYDLEAPPSPKGALLITDDFLTRDIAAPGAAVVMNPPFKLAKEFIRKANSITSGGTVCALLRLAFLGSSTKRIDLVGPGSTLRRVIVMARRPSFSGDGKTDATDYAWFVWGPGEGPAEIEVVPR